MKNAVIGNRNQKEKFVQSQIIPKCVYSLDVYNYRKTSLINTADTLIIWTFF